MQFSIEAILSTVAATKGSSASAPCELNPLLELVKHVTGDISGPSAPGFMTECVVTGLVVLEQHPRLATVKFRRSFANDALYETWLAGLHLPRTLTVKRPSRSYLKRAYEEAAPIVRRNMEAIRRRKH